MRKNYFFSLILIGSFFSELGAAQTSSIGDSLLQTSDKIALTIDETAESLDLLLAGREYTKAENKSNLKVSQIVGWSEGGQQVSSTDFGLNLRLPNLERRWQLRFTSYDEEAEARDLAQRKVRLEPRERDYGAGIIFLKNLGNVRASFLPRLKLADPLEVSHTLRFESTAKSGSLQLRPRLEFFADPNRGTGIFGTIDFTSELTDRTDFNIQLDQEYRERGNLFLTQQSVGFEYSLAKNKGLGFSVITSSDNRPRYGLTSLMLAPGYALQAVPHRLRFGLTPYLKFLRANRFKGHAGVSLLAEITF